ncbi:hypothetical protein Dtox_3418 [Desulfofarcimen acetoxidans DSM 771]|uniref:Uncharacterized protein n=1 Tax=Desulfofarcimen acetoxidans (strain ATCC 49208 / DSM 771 / KCTC 5769 / VKM B-1644 / 5575) TaxID=485916 RepID=C8W6N3_DESAS|nr:DUF6809 family protein [Desulfofarcimen acetoxidans]ACV64142.1 hypothetical protein Dtox_3418 [Desulfofarcimen acetoxidans DSM 771]
MNDILDELYQRFYHPSPQTDLQREIEDAHRQLIERLEKPERKLVLRIIDTKDMITGSEAQESFNCDFWLAWRLFTQLHNYNSGRLVEENLSEDDRFSMQKGTDDEN